MEIPLKKLLPFMGNVMDTIEMEMLGASPKHSLRVALLSAAMAKVLGMKKEEIFDLALCGLLHDNALTAYVLSGFPNTDQQLDFRQHCKIGQENLKKLPFFYNVEENNILYHHERPDRKGPFALYEEIIPLGASLIAAADMIDMQYELNSAIAISPESFLRLQNDILRGIGKMYTNIAGYALLEIMDENLLWTLNDNQILNSFISIIPNRTVVMSEAVLSRFSIIANHAHQYRNSRPQSYSIYIADTAIKFAHYCKYSLYKADLII
jgi:hypothetical protein